MTYAALLKGITPFLRSVGRWILKRLSSKGVMKLIGYMDGKIDEFIERRKRARAPRRKRWLAGRIKRWSAALKWLEANAARLTGKAVEAIDKAAGAAIERIPLRAASDRFAQRGPFRTPRGRRAN